jgi:plastocyanin
MKAIVTLLSIAVLATFAAAQSGKRATVTIKDLKYSPATITIRAGDTVTWTNDDDRDHTVVASDGSFNSGTIGSGESFSHTFEKAGKYPYGCRLHPRMKGMVVVQ